MKDNINNILNKKDAITVRREIKKRIGDHVNHLPVIVTSGNKPPTLTTQEEIGWYTNGGHPISSPSAYSKKGFSNMVYHKDDREILVGVCWLRKFAGGKSFKEQTGRL